jgi:hypothetical protein
MRFLLALALLSAPALAQDSAEAMQLYNKGVKQLDAGKGDDARKTFQSIIKDYPSSAYSKLAKEGMERPLIESITFADIHPLSEKEARHAFEAANLTAGHVYTSEYNDQARNLVAQLMVKRKIRAKDIAVTTKELPDHKVAMTINVVR